MIFSDILYGRIDIPDFYIPFLKMPEFVRLRGVRLSNVDSFEFKDFNGPSRWEHSIGVLNLALQYSKLKKLNKSDECHLCLAALLHDVATPPFAHTIEYIFENFDHEYESFNLLNSNKSDFLPHNTPVYTTSLPIFTELCRKKTREVKFKIDPEIISEMISGGGDLGFLINGTIDLDNIDNVCRSSTHMGIDVNKNVPYKLVEWLSGFNSAPSDIFDITEEPVKSWIGYRTQMYSLFFTSSEEELGRQAFLQHIIRRAFEQGMSKESIIWNTDESLLSQIENLDRIEKIDHCYKYNIGELVQRYRLMDSVKEYIKIPIETSEILAVIKNPLFATWLEKRMSTKWFEPFVIVNEKRFKGNTSGQLFQQHKGEIILFHLSSHDVKREQFPEWIVEKTAESQKGKILRKKVQNIIQSELNEWLVTKPWTVFSEERRNNIISNLNHYRDWSFFKTRNQSLHAYPGTFVQSIPSSLISALGLQGELIMDTFGGTGQTATEAIKHGCSVVSIDSNSIASMVADVKFTYLTADQREVIRKISSQDLIESPAEMVKNKEINKWFHPRTIEELSRIRTFFQNFDDLNISHYLKMCFSSILTSCTARKGKDYAYFADNTPLPNDLECAPYISPYSIFLSKVNRNLSIIEEFYGSLGEGDVNLLDRLEQAKIVHSDFLKTSTDSLGIEPKSVKAIITSPPYLCMIDYTLGQRLSYRWLFPEEFDIDFEEEIGKRRDRGNSKKAIDNYYEAFRRYAKKTKEYLSKGGYLVTVLGAPQANSFKEIELFDTVDKVFEDEGYSVFWDKFRPISWHRNRGHAHLKEERITVYVLNE
ncbi:HD domain-containing protein [uncultured Draconibacterium sp.]|uniref:HD domain-containing protein n=1 Tax=uncultured Draconibacterium sp. TaxID=1573823 RepID=UPI0029C677E8|nr:HD domain-containing protein [uncultured Draconibacterium sp.]